MTEEIVNPPRRVFCPACNAITVNDVVPETRDTDRCVCRMCGHVHFLPAEQIAGFRPTPGPLNQFPTN